MKKQLCLIYQKKRLTWFYKFLEISFPKVGQNIGLSARKPQTKITRFFSLILQISLHKLSKIWLKNLKLKSIEREFADVLVIISHFFGFFSAKPDYVLRVSVWKGHRWIFQLWFNGGLRACYLWVNDHFKIWPHGCW